MREVTVSDRTAHYSLVYSRKAWQVKGDVVMRGAVMEGWEAALEWIKGMSGEAWYSGRVNYSWEFFFFFF